MLGNLTTGAKLRKEIAALDNVRDDEEITRLVSNVLFADAYFAHSIYLVTFARQAAVPGIAKVLWRSGQGDIVVDPMRRNDDTIVYFTEFYRRGYSSPEGKEAIATMERIHSKFLIDEELKVYTLSTVMLEPDRLAQQFGFDPFTPHDKEARWHFWQGFANEMGLELPAQTRDGFLEWMIDYEKRNYAKTEGGVAIFDALVADWERWYPDWLPRNKYLARQSLISLLDDDLREAMGQPEPPAYIRFQTRMVAQTYLRSTPLRVFNKDRNLINYFGKRHLEPRDLTTVGHPVDHQKTAA